MAAITSRTVIGFGGGSRWKSLTSAPALKRPLAPVITTALISASRSAASIAASSCAQYSNDSALTGGLSSVMTRTPSILRRDHALAILLELRLVQRHHVCRAVHDLALVPGALRQHVRRVERRRGELGAIELTVRVAGRDLIRRD